MHGPGLRVQCPTCGKTVLRSHHVKAPFFPFCSERCKLIDLGKWLDGEHRIEEPLEPGATDREPQAPEN